MKADGDVTSTPAPDQRLPPFIDKDILMPTFREVGAAAMISMVWFGWLWVLLILWEADKILDVTAWVCRCLSAIRKRLRRAHA